ncbi:GntR family transcriptional regulator [Devosia sp. A449]
MKDMKLEQPRSLAEMVAVRLRSAIIDGEIGLGESIAEEKLAESFGVSRTPVRDALVILQMQGLVTVQPKRGSQVFIPTVEDVVLMCEFRKLTEVNAMELAIQRNKASLVASLRTTVAAMGQARENHDAVLYGKLDTNFHQAFVDFSGNPFIADAYALVAGQIAALRHHLTRPIESLREISFAEHNQFVDLVEQGDVKGFREVMDLHVDRTGAIYVSALEATSPTPQK